MSVDIGIKKTAEENSSTGETRNVLLGGSQNGDRLNFLVFEPYLHVCKTRCRCSYALTFLVPIDMRPVVKRR